MGRHFGIEDDNGGRRAGWMEILGLDGSISACFLIFDCMPLQFESGIQRFGNNITHFGLSPVIFLCQIFALDTEGSTNWLH